MKNGQDALKLVGKETNGQNELKFKKHLIVEKNVRGQVKEMRHAM